MSDILHSVNQTLQELERLHQLNLELIEQPNTIMKWIIDNEIPIPNKDALFSLLRKAEALQNEIYAGKTITLSYKKLSDDGYHDDKNRRKVNRVLILIHDFCDFHVRLVNILCF